MGKWEEKIGYALRDTSFPGSNQFEQAPWLFRHPDMCRVIYEEIVGSCGGGSRRRRLVAISFLLAHVGCEEDPGRIAGNVYGKRFWGFFRGTVVAWRECFTKKNLAQSSESFGGLPAQYGCE